VGSRFEVFRKETVRMGVRDANSHGTSEYGGPVLP
jgi:hypothetical protein